MTFAQGFAIPCLLFRAISTLDLGQNFDLRLLASFYTGALTGFFARHCRRAAPVRARPWEDCVAIGFAACSRTRCCWACRSPSAPTAPTALRRNYAIIALHAPVLLRPRHHRDGDGARPRRPLCAAAAAGSLSTMFTQRAGHRHHPGLHRQPGRHPAARGAGRGARPDGPGGAASGALRAGRRPLPLPPGGRHARDPVHRRRLAAAASGDHLRARPRLCGLSVPELRSATITAAMAPGVNAYLFANMYGGRASGSRRRRC